MKTNKTDECIYTVTGKKTAPLNKML